MPNGDPRDLDTFNDNFDDEHYGYVDGINDGSKAQAPPRRPSSDDGQAPYGPLREPCPECSEPAVWMGFGMLRVSARGQCS